MEQGIVKIAIVDNGVWFEHPELIKKDHVIKLESFVNDEKVQNCGHGTAIYHIISSTCPFAEIVNFKITNSDEIDEELLCTCLEDIAVNYNFDIVNISMGITICDDLERLRIACERISMNDGIVISAFDNFGAISYPAAFKCVIGVTSSKECRGKEDFVIYNDDVVNVGANGGLQRIAWDVPPYIIASGNSFACAHVTAKIAQIINDGVKGWNEIFKKLIEISKYSEMVNACVTNSRCKPTIKKGVLFPFNKEMHALVRFEDMLDFEIVGIYDTKYSSHIGSDTRHVLNANVITHPIKNIEKIDWDSFDTMILGHTSELASLLPKLFIDNIIDEALKRNKKIFSFDDLSSKWKTGEIYSPIVDNSQLPHFRMGKLFKISKPVLGIFGTSSSQGKYTLQLELRKKLLADGYKLGQIGTEPNADLFNMDCAFPIGYNSLVNIQGHDVVRYLNNIINGLCIDKNVDLVIVGSQSSVIPYDNGNLNLFPIKQYAFLLGTQPDAGILCINPYDDFEYIKRSVDYLESLVNCKIIGLSMYPMDINTDWTGMYGKKSILKDERFMSLREQLFNKFEIPVFKLGDLNDFNKMYSTIINYFSE